MNTPLPQQMIKRALLAFALGLTAVCSAMEPPVGMVDEPCPPALAMPASAKQVLSDLFMQPRTLLPADFESLMKNAEFAAYDQELRRRGGADWAGLCRYRAANFAAARARNRAVFIGDSITENWLLGDPQFFSGDLVNRGIGAQTSAQMLVRFRADVVALHPAVVHILAGTNDVAGNNGPLGVSDFTNNIESMAEIARANGIRVVLGSIPPATTFSWRPAMRPAPRIAELNQWLRSYARRNGFVYVDYHAALRGSAEELRSTLGNDGVHPNRDGYVVMRKLAEAALVEASRSSDE
jgi:lysophospholipase L1-like esterase